MLSIIVYLIFLFSASYSDENNLIVQTSLGAIKGSIKTSFGGRKFSAFEGIPFAKPPIGDLRFESPQPIRPWYGTWDATHLTACPQANMTQLDQIEGTEDCLYLNIYVPNENPNAVENLDVIIHIHGGAFMVGSGHFYSGAEVLMDQNIIFVTFNYRIGILGFLSTEDNEVPGNNGLKDQVLALQWVKKYVANFGGNPDSITITGLSAGGSSVHFHYLSDMSKGLFKRGISNSGVASNPWSMQEGALVKAKILANAVGCPSEDTKILVKCLKQKPHKQLLEKMSLFYGFGPLPIAPFGPVVERGANAFLKAHPYELMKRGEVLDVPWILSSTAHEGYSPQILNEGFTKTLEENWNSIAPVVLDFNYTLDSSQWKDVSKKVKEFYFGRNKISEETLEMFTKMFGDRLFSVDAEIAVKLHADAVKSPVYFYLFDYPGDDGTKFVPHAADAKYFFGPVFNPTPLTENELTMRSNLMEMLISYIKTGTPKIKSVKWKPTKGNKLTYLHINGFSNEDFKMKTVEELNPIKFWKSLKISEYESLVNARDEL